MHQPSVMLQRLDAETRGLHADVDAHWLDLMAAGVTREQYRDVLIKIYGFESPLESAFAYTPHLLFVERRERTRSGLIAQDLLELGVTPARITSLPQCPTIAPFTDPAEALGWKYVLERPTQMHGAIKRNLVMRMHDVANACRYLSSSDGVAAARWQQFGSLLDEVAAEPPTAERLFAGAKAAFACMSDWFKRTDVTS